MSRGMQIADAGMGMRLIGTQRESEVGGALSASCPPTHYNLISKPTPQLQDPDSCIAQSLPVQLIVGQQVSTDT